MVDSQLVRRRLVAQGLSSRPFAEPRAAVAALGAMQGQDLPGVMSSIALRLSMPERGREAPEEAASQAVRQVIGAFDDGSIVRGYPMRGTVFAVAAEDLRWMTELCAAGPTRAQVRRRGALGLDQEQVDSARRLLEDALGTAPRGMSRQDVFSIWERAGLSPAKGRGYHLLSHLIATGVAAFGPWNGRDNDVVLAETWLPAGSSLADRFGGDREAATTELLRRYLRGHGPATVRDFAWWTKLPLGMTRRALTAIREELDGDVDESGEQRFWRPGLLDEVHAAGSDVDAVRLLPGFDELVLGYQDRTYIVAQEHHQALVPGNNGIFQRGILQGGRIVGTWRREGRAGRRSFATAGFAELDAGVLAEAEKVFQCFPHVGE